MAGQLQPQGGEEKPWKEIQEKQEKKVERNDKEQGKEASLVAGIFCSCKISSLLRLVWVSLNLILLPKCCISMLVWIMAWIKD